MAFFAWSLRHQADLVSRRWGDDLLVWHQRSGDTHLLSGLAARVFDHLCGGSAATQDIQHAVAHARTDLEAGRAEVEATLQDMMRLGLVTAHPL